ncbi:MAG TPA: transglycosylase SLT domain-containing protein [Thermoanaerobaculia bacterium]|nr:transglycosylase SLT domain-containing protein [Thermoanaerobaculia bacterium]
MLGTFALALAVTAADPRPDLVELQLTGQQQQALARVEQELAERPEPSHKLGLDYLRGHLLDTLRRLEDAGEAFARTLTAAPALKLHAYYRLAYDADLLGHPEVAAGLVANTAAGDPSSPLLPEAIRLLARTIVEGGDCQLLRRLRTEAMPAPQRREIQLAQVNCAQRTGYPDFARSLLVSLLGESQDDEIARLAAERLAATISESEHGRVPLLIGITFQRHNDLDRALLMLQRALGKGDALPAREVYETQIRMGEIELAQQRWAEAAVAFTRLAGSARSAADRAHALYLEGRSHELRGAMATADRNFRQAYAAEPQGAWAPRALLAALRLECRAGSEQQALTLYEKLTADPKWRAEAARAALFLAASDLVRGRQDRVKAWLTKARQGGHDDRLEADYWNGRLAELEKNGQEAVDRYLDVLRADPDHPLARAARTRLAAEPLARTAAAEGRRLAGSGRVNDVYGAWLLLGDDPAGRAAQHRLEQMLLGDRRAAPFLRLAAVPARRWPLWQKTLSKPEEMLLALGVWHAGAAAVRDHFPLSDPPLGFTGALLLARGGDLAGSIAMGEALRARAPSRVPLALQPPEYRRLLYPFPYRQNILAVGPIRGVDPNLLAALIREESHFDTSMLTPASSRGLTHLSLTTARRLAGQLNLQQRLSPEDLYRPEVSISLGAAYLGALLKDFSGSTVAAVAAYDAGEAEALLWRSQCFTQEPEELYTKLGTAETRDYVRRVLGAWEEYRELY